MDSWRAFPAGRDWVAEPRWVLAQLVPARSVLQSGGWVEERLESCCWTQVVLTGRHRSTITKPARCVRNVAWLIVRGSCQPVVKNSVPEDASKATPGYVLEDGCISTSLEGAPQDAELSARRTWSTRAAVDSRKSARVFFPSWVASSAVEQSPYKRWVAGSIPVPPTKKTRGHPFHSRVFRLSVWAFASYSGTCFL